jgi:hypothetical protein
MYDQLKLNYFDWHKCIVSPYKAIYVFGNLICAIGKEYYLWISEVK